MQVLKKGSRVKPLQGFGDGVLKNLLIFRDLGGFRLQTSNKHTRAWLHFRLRREKN